MKILALDASGQVASIALAEDDKLLGEYTMNTKKTHSQTLLPMVDALLHLIGEDKNTIDAVAVAGGPGSFTGLRIGSATAKGLSYAWGVPIISVPTVDAIAYNMVGSDGLICPVLDARRQQTYTGIYAFHAIVDHAQEMEVLRPECAVKIEEIVADLNERGEKVTFLGDGVPVVQAHDLIDLVQAAAHVAGELLHSEGVGARGDLDGLDVLLHVAGQAAAVAGEHKAHALGLGGVGLGREGAHHDDVGVAQDLGDVLGHVETVAGAGIAIDDVFAHRRTSCCRIFG